MKVSVIVVTRNRADDLKQTLEAIRRVHVPHGLAAELLVVDNGSTDGTGELVRNEMMPAIRLRYAREGTPGISIGRNRGLRETDGDFILFTDDDVRPPGDWLSGMCEPMIREKASVVAGGVKLAPGLLRPWMEPLHRSYLASTEWLKPEAPHGMVGANMGFRRDVLERVPAFDPELGPGALGFGDEELFANQLQEAGYRIFSRLHLCVEHHFHPSRLQRSAWVDAAARRGAVNAYLTYHWHHRGYKFARLRLLLASLRLRSWRKRNAGKLAPEGCAEAELRLVYWCGELRAYLRERQRPRCYGRRGLVKMDTGRRVACRSNSNSG